MSDAGDHTSSRAKLVVYGAGNPDAVKLIAAINRASPTWDLIGFIDDTPEKAGASLFGVPILGSSALLATLDLATVHFHNNVAATTTDRRTVTRRLSALGCRFASLVHPSVDLACTEIGAGVSIEAFVHLGAAVTMGDYCALRHHASIGHESRLADHVFVGPGTLITGRVVVESGAFLGAGCIIRNGVTVGADSVVAAGAVVVDDVPVGARVGGVPARPLPPPRPR